MSFNGVLIDQTAGRLIASGEKITPDVLKKAADLITVYLNRYVGEMWGLPSGGCLVRAGADPLDVGSNEIPAHIRPTILEAPTAEAYHTLNGLAIPDIEDGLSLSNNLWGPGGWLTAMTHEWAETRGNPGTNLWCADWLGRLYAQELCVSGDTLVRMANGDSISIETLADRGGFFDVLGCAGQGGTVAARGGHARCTHASAATVRVVFTDGTSLRCTPNHEVLLESGRYAPAAELVPGQRLRQVAPRTSLANAVDSREVYAKASGDDFGGLGVVANLRHDSVGQFGAAGTFSEQATITSHPSLGGSVKHVLSVSPEEEVVGADARGSVACVADLKAVRNPGVMEFEREAMGEHDAPAIANLAVAHRVLGAHPYPATTGGLTNAGPESLLQRGSAAIEGRESSIQSPVATHAAPVSGAESLGAQGARAPIDHAFGHGKTVARVERDSNTRVFDLTVPATSNFGIGPGVFVHNCDAIEMQSWLLALPDGTSGYVSNFLLPSFFTPGGRAPYDYMTYAGIAGAVAPTAPFTTAAGNGGNYQIVELDPGHAQQVHAMRAAGAPVPAHSRVIVAMGDPTRRLAKKRHQSSRPYRIGLRPQEVA